MSDLVCADKTLHADGPHYTTAPPYPEYFIGLRMLGAHRDIDIDMLYFVCVCGRFSSMELDIYREKNRGFSKGFHVFLFLFVASFVLEAGFSGWLKCFGCLINEGHDLDKVLMGANDCGMANFCRLVCP